MRQAAKVGDVQLVKLLKPALDDKRDANINLGAGGIDKDRVCDRAAGAINELLDVDPWLAFKQDGSQGWETNTERIKTYDTIIANLKKRLEQNDSID